MQSIKLGSVFSSIQQSLSQTFDAPLWIYLRYRPVTPNFWFCSWSMSDLFCSTYQLKEVFFADKTGNSLVSLIPIFGLYFCLAACCPAPSAFGKRLPGVAVETPMFTNHTWGGRRCCKTEPVLLPFLNLENVIFVALCVVVVVVCVFALCVVVVVVVWVFSSLCGCLCFCSLCCCCCCLGFCSLCCCCCCCCCLGFCLLCCCCFCVLN